MSVIVGQKIPQFDVFGKPSNDSSHLLEFCPEDTCLVGPITKGLLPGMYKLKEFKEVAGVGMAYQLQVTDRQDLICIHLLV